MLSQLYNGGTADFGQLRQQPTSAHALIGAPCRILALPSEGHC